MNISFHNLIIMKNFNILKAGKEIIVFFFSIKTNFKSKFLIFLFCNFLQIGKDRSLGYDPNYVGWFSKGEYVVVGGSNKQCCLHTKEGVKLGVIGDQTSWTWSAAVRPDSNYVVSS